MGGGLAGGALARGISTAANLPGPTTGVLALAGPTRVTVNSRAALRAGVDFASSCNGLPFNHIHKPGPVLIAQGSRTVTINGMPMARLEIGSVRADLICSSGPASARTVTGFEVKPAKPISSARRMVLRAPSQATR